jgi:hypothetical protein
MAIFIVLLYLAVPFQYFWSVGSKMNTRASSYDKERAQVTATLNAFKTSDDRTNGWEDNPLATSKAYDEKDGGRQDRESDEYEYQKRRYEELLKAVPDTADSPSLGRTFAALVQASSATVQTLSIQPAAKAQEKKAAPSDDEETDGESSSGDDASSGFERGQNCVPTREVGRSSVEGEPVVTQSFSAAISGQRESMEVLYQVLYTNTRDLQGRLIAFDAMKIDFTTVGETSEARISVTGHTYFVGGLWEPVEESDAGTSCKGKK